MKIQCSVCEAAEAAVMCCADEAALCSACDRKVHAANKLAGKHQRVPLSGDASQMPKCDICQLTRLKVDDLRCVSWGNLSKICCAMCCEEISQAEHGIVTVT